MLFLCSFLLTACFALVKFGGSRSLEIKEDPLLFCKKPFKKQFRIDLIANDTPYVELLFNFFELCFPQCLNRLLVLRCIESENLVEKGSFNPAYLSGRIE